MPATLKRLALIGYGKMGHLVGQLAPEYGFEVVGKLDSKSNASCGGIASLAGGQVDVAIEFSTPQTAAMNLEALAQAKIPAVAGATGWFEHLAEVTAAVDRNGTGLVWSPNFSVGVAVFRKLAGAAAQLLQDQPDYGAWAWEIHHSSKQDSPSGTMLQLVETLRQNGYDRSVNVTASRAGSHPGTHEIGFDSPADTITLRHAARNREGFARGALQSANWIVSRQGVYTFDDVLFGKSSASY